MNNDPRDIINREPMKARQILVIGLCVFLNALDGFDILAITFAAPGIMQDWSIGKDVMGIVFSAGLLSMTLGSFVLPPLADRIGRRKITLICLVIMSGGMFLSALSSDIYHLAFWRFITGLGIGGMIPTINAISSEFSNEKRRNFSVCVMGIGYAIGGFVGGSAAAVLLSHFAWPSVFIFGGCAALLILPVAYFFMPESIEFLVTRKGQEALPEANAILRTLGHSEAEEIRISETPAKAGIMELFTRDKLRLTLALTFSYLLNIMTVYYILTWVPSIVTDLGFDKVNGTQVSVWVSVGGIIGGALFGWVATFRDLRKMLIALMLSAGVLVIIFGQVPPDLMLLKIVGFLLGFCIYGSTVGLFALLARSYPTTLRATGTGFVVGAGRGGSTIGPVIVGFLLAAGFGIPEVSIIMASGAIIAGLILLLPVVARQSTAPQA
ncbi:MFS transporter [Emcibacter nanhaiensis]|uniref:MFS transporter n=1 Tax=Emcibacter nanhaiensis TaxID=1505037 RepID=A0A501PEY9_9PROT|nr:MFS transporter [Emcibacter nanhaiensis]TPD59009.1 MFS transporter [Emcibacter nanhaiensis]